VWENIKFKMEKRKEQMRYKKTGSIKILMNAHEKECKINVDSIIHLSWKS